MDMTHYDCSIGNPFAGPGRIQLRIEVNPLAEVVGSEDDVFINFTVSSINPENSSTIVDNSNFVTVQLMFEAQANVTIDNG